MLKLSGGGFWVLPLYKLSPLFSGSHAPFLGLVCTSVSDDLHSHPGGLWSLHLLLRARTPGSP